ncbi:MAG: ABC transporter ATP-binding protein [Pseudomonadota bacterium]
MLVADRLTRKYGDFLAVSDVSFSIAQGEIVGLLGPNGAGKTTIMKMMTGFLEPTSGQILIDGVNIEEARAATQAKIGYLPENCPVYPEMTVLDYLDYAAALRNMPEADRGLAIARAIDATALHEKAGEPISSLSRGLRQRAGVAQAILHAPRIVILDEPTNGLDPSQIRQMRALIKRLAETATVIVSTHILQEVQAVCDRAIIINRGSLMYDAPLSELGGGGKLAISTSLRYDTLQKVLGGLGTISTVEDASTDTHSFELTIDQASKPADSANLNKAAADVSRRIIEAGGELFALSPARNDLDQIFAEISAGTAKKLLNENNQTPSDSTKEPVNV